MNTNTDEKLSHHSSGIDVKDIGGDINQQTKKGIDAFLSEPANDSNTPSVGAKMLS